MGLMIEEYLEKREEMKRVFMLVDFRIKPTENDLLMYQFLKYYNSIMASLDDNFNQEKVLQDVIDKFNIKDVLKSDKETKNKLNTNLNKIFFDVDNQSKIKVSIDCHIDILSDNYLTIINVGDEVTNEDIINCSLCAFIFKSMYRIRDLKVRIYNPILDQLINVEYDNFNNCYSLLLLNRYIGFKQLTSELFIENNLEVYNSYFE